MRIYDFWIRNHSTTSSAATRDIDTGRKSNEFHDSRAGIQQSVGRIKGAKAH